MKDFYKTLGVDVTANDAELKAAFRKSALKYHPDKNPNDPEAESKFKEINEAYQELSDPQKRAAHDYERVHGTSHPGNQGFRPGGFRNQGFDFAHNMGQGEPHFEDIIRQFFEQAGPFTRNQPRQNRNINTAIEITLESAFTGINFPLTVDNAGTKVNVSVAVPAGINNGARMRYQGFGEKTLPNVPPGDLYITIYVSEHPIFRRENLELNAELKVDAIDAMIGADVEFKCIDDTKISINVPPGTQNGTVMRIPGKGMPNYQNPGQRGAMMLTVAITIPTNLSEYDIKRLSKIAKRIHT